MTETRTARLGLPLWGAGTDSGSRLDFDEAFTNLELWAARDEFGTRANRPAAGVRGRYYTASDTKAMYRDNGATWDVIGGVIEGGVNLPTASASIANIIKGLGSQTGDLTQWQNSAGSVLGRVRADGSLHIPGGTVASQFGSGTDIGGAVLAASPVNASTSAIVARGFAGQVEDIQKWQASSGATIASILADGSAMFTNRVTVLTAPVNTTDLVNKAYVDSTFLLKSTGESGSVDLATETALRIALGSTVSTHTNNTLAHGATGAVMGTNNVQTVTNKSLSGANNTFSNIPSVAVYGVDQVIAGLATHIADIEEHGATGAVVGTTNSQTLINKIVSGDANTFLNIPRTAIVNNIGIPYAVAAGSVTFQGATLAPYNPANFSITFPAGRFSVAPIIECTIRDAPGGTAALVPRALNGTATGFSCYLYNTANISQTYAGCSVGWTATQMNSGAAAG